MSAADVSCIVCRADDEHVGEIRRKEHSSSPSCRAVDDMSLAAPTRDNKDHSLTPAGEPLTPAPYIPTEDEIDRLAKIGTRQPQWRFYGGGGGGAWGHAPRI